MSGDRIEPPFISEADRVILFMIEAGLPLTWWQMDVVIREMEHTDDAE
jgi:hypothetical protein